LETKTRSWKPTAGGAASKDASVQRKKPQLSYHDSGVRKERISISKETAQNRLDSLVEMISSVSLRKRVEAIPVLDSRLLAAEA
jgi:hypothetical protein